MGKKALWLGTATGFILASVLWLIEKLTGSKVYTLLLNIDFIPVMGAIEWPIWMEWFFHIIIAWIIAYLYIWWTTNKSVKMKWLTSFVLTVGAALSYFPLTLLAIKETPPVTDGTAIFYWLIGHLFFAVSLVKLDQWWTYKSEGERVT